MRRYEAACRVLLIIGLVTGVLGSLPGPGYAVSLIPVIPPGADSAQAWGINNNNDTVGLYGFNAGRNAGGFLRTSDGSYHLIDVGVPTNVFPPTWFKGINDTGVIVGDGARVGAFPEAIVLTPQGSSYSIQRLFPSNAEYSSAHGINNAGVVVGLVQQQVNGQRVQQGFVSGPNQVRLISVPGTRSTEINDINDRGQIVGTADTIVPDPRGSGGVGSATLHGFIGTPLPNGDYTFDLFDAPGASSSTFARGINNQGQIVGNFNSSTSTFPGFIREADGKIGPLSVGPLTQLFGINDQGTLVGFDGGFRTGYIAIGAVPEPSSGSLLLAGCGAYGIGLFMRRRRASHVENR
jgi:uncharacterized membrane protein